MSDSISGLSDLDEASDELKDVIATELEAGEEVLWTGRPVPGRVLRRSIPKSLVGLFFIAFTLFWMYAVVQGRNNNWDRGKVVGPFATHNVLIAACAGLWFLPPGIYMLSWPVRAWWQARRTDHVVTNRRALIIKPGFFGGQTILSFLPEALTLIQCEERQDGSGDLILENRKTWVGMPQPEGFVAIKHVREVEALIRKRLVGKGLSDDNLSVASQGGDQDITLQASRVMVLPRTYGLSLVFRAVLVLFGVVFSLTTLLGAVRVLAVPLVFLMRILPAGAGTNLFTGELVGSAVCLAGFVFLTRSILTSPVEISIDEERIISFRSWFRTISLPAGEIISIRTGGWKDPNRFLAEVWHKGGKVYLLNQFSDFRDFLSAVKALNPSVEVIGF